VPSRHRASDPTAPPHPAADGLWRRAMSEGNEAYRRHDDAAAMACYRRALALAQADERAWSGHDARLAALVVSAHNLADLHLRRAEAGQAGRCLADAHLRLAAIAAAPGRPDDERLAAQRQGRCTYAELLRFLQRHPDQSDAARAAAVFIDYRIDSPDSGRTH